MIVHHVRVIPLLHRGGNHGGPAGGSYKTTTPLMCVETIYKTASPVFSETLETPFPDRIFQRLPDLNDQAVLIGPHDGLEPASVLVPLFWRRGTWRLLLIRRPEDAPTHRGQIAFPGGRLDDDDPDHLYTALREAREELGLNPLAVEIIGELPKQVTTSTGFEIHPYVGLLQEPFPLSPDPREVDEVITAPLNRFQSRYRLPGEKPRYPYGDGEVIWGATAAIIERLMRFIT